MQNKNQLIKTLDNMKCKNFSYANRIHYFLSYTIDEVKEKIKIVTNLDEFERNFDSVSEFISYWIETNILPATLPFQENNQIAVFMESEKSVMNDLTDILLDNIKKVQDSKEYIPQAQAINNNVNSIINLSKLKLDVVKQIRLRK